MRGRSRAAERRSVNEPECLRQSLVNQSPAVLRVILEFDDVEISIVGFQQMRLRAASHFANEPTGVYGHGVWRKRKSVAEENIT